MAPIAHSVTLDVLAKVMELASVGVGLYVALSLRAQRAEFREEMAKLENRLYERINGTYVRTELCEAKFAQQTVAIEAIRSATSHKPSGAA